MSEDPHRTDEYAGFARTYDPFLNPLLDPLRRRITAIAVNVVRDMADESTPKALQNTVLDLCCGTGRQAASLHRAGLAVHGVDNSPAMLAVARTKTPATIAYHQEDASATHFPDQSFPCVVISLALHEKQPAKREAILDEAIRLLIPEGSLIVLDYRLPETGLGRGAMGLAALVERMAGSEHHTNYRQFLAAGGMRALLGARRLPFQRLETFFLGCFGLYRAFRRREE
ncbi:MAG: class I SAM-dependent methyltransferase [Desulfovibrionaceae bacterium]